MEGELVMESSTNHGNEPDYGMGYGEGGSPDYGLDLDMELRGPEDEQVMHVNPDGGELPGPDVDAEAEPYEGMEFETEDQAWTFYNIYAKQLGFTTRVNNYHRSRRDGSITSREFVCAKEGFRKTRGKREASGDGKTKRSRGIARVECKAMIRVRKQENGKWVVSKFQKVHNHSMASQSGAHCLRPDSFLFQRTIDTQHVRVDQSINGLPLCRDEPQQTLHSGYTSDDHISHTGVGQPSTIARETQNILEYLKLMQVEDSDFFYALQFDDDQCIGNVFWAEARSRMAYKYFGDSVSFDTSYKANQYQIPLAIFSGVNHHWQPVLFGCALLVDDSLPSLVWLFKTLLSAMSDRHPVSLITDRDKDVQAAVAHVFPETRHRLCKWHILKEGQDKLSNVYRSYPSFGGEFQKCIIQTETIDEFESCWWTLVSRYSLGDNEWLQSLYNLRHQWVPVFLRNSFFAEASSANRCESRSTFFEGHISAQTPPHAFVQQYDKALDSRYEKEVKADFDTIYSLPHLKTPSPMEKQAAESYTRRMFMKFQEEFIQTFVYTANKINEEGSASTFKVSKFEEEHRAYIVIFDSSETTATCSCQLFENSGILCRHILTVFSITSVVTLPPHYILKRWTRNAKKDETNVPENKIVLDETKAEPQKKNQDSRESLTSRYNSLCREAIKYAEDGATSIDIYNVAIRALQDAVKKVTAAKANMGKSGQFGSLADGTEVANQADKTMEKDLQDCWAKVGEHVTNSQGSNAEGQVLAPSDIRQLAPGQEGRHMLFQQPFNILLIAPGLPGDSGVSNVSPAPPVALNISSSQAQLHTSMFTAGNQGRNASIPFMLQNKLLPSAASAGGLGGKGSVLISPPGGSIQEGDLRHGSAPLLPQILNVATIGQANPNPVAGANSTGSSAPSEPQLMAVPMAFYVPMMGNVPVAPSAPATCNPSASSPGIQSSLATFPVTLLPQEVASGSPLVSPMAATIPTNCAPAAALSPGAMSPSTTAATIKAAQARNIARRRSRRGSSRTSTTPCGYNRTLVPRTWVPQPQNAHLCFTGLTPSVPSSTAIIPDAPRIGNQQVKVHSSRESVSPEVVIVDEPGHAGKVPVQVQTGVASLTAEVVTPKAAVWLQVSPNNPSIVPEEPNRSQAGNSSRLVATISETDVWRDPVSMPLEPDKAQTSLANFGPSYKQMHGEQEVDLPG
uniref:Protein FAR1-RELATED SEQUENCE 5 n=1 Tax=Anthurium amnicola TaxID=1678845 RepID=A0A1D1YYZ1_9ARAE